MRATTSNRLIVQRLRVWTQEVDDDGDKRKTGSGSRGRGFEPQVIAGKDGINEYIALILDMCSAVGLANLMPTLFVMLMPPKDRPVLSFCPRKLCSSFRYSF